MDELIPVYVAACGHWTAVPKAWEFHFEEGVTVFTKGPDRPFEVALPSTLGKTTYLPGLPMHFCSACADRMRREHDA